MVNDLTWDTARGPVWPGLVFPWLVWWEQRTVFGFLDSEATGRSRPTVAWKLGNRIFQGLICLQPG